MPDRDIEEMVLRTIKHKLVEITNIPASLINPRMPDFEFINKVNGTLQPQTNKDQFPSIGMKYYDKVRYSANTHGDSILVNNNNGTAIDYQPQGEMMLPISIYLFTDTSKEQRTICNKIIQEFGNSPFYDLYDDEIDGEYVGVEFIGFNDLVAHRPFIRCIDINCRTRTLNEVSGYVVDGFGLTLQSSVNSLAVNVNEEDAFSYFEPQPPDEIDENTIYFQDWNIVRIDLTDDFGGIYERVEDSQSQ